MTSITAEPHETPWVPENTFASRLKLVRHDVGMREQGRELSIEEAAERCQIKAPTWSTWERLSKPQDMAEVVEKIHTGLGVDRQWLMWGSALGYKLNELTVVEQHDEQMEFPFTPRASLIAV